MGDKLFYYPDEVKFYVYLIDEQKVIKKAPARGA